MFLRSHLKLCCASTDFEVGVCSKRQLFQGFRIMVRALRLLGLALTLTTGNVPVRGRIREDEMAWVNVGE